MLLLNCGAVVKVGVHSGSRGVANGALANANRQSNVTSSVCAQNSGSESLAVVQCFSLVVVLLLLEHEEDVIDALSVACSVAVRPVREHSLQTASLTPHTMTTPLSVLLLPKVTDDKSGARLALVFLLNLFALAGSANEEPEHAARGWYVKICEIQKKVNLHFNQPTPGM
jgi:hypothetical protein